VTCTETESSELLNGYIVWLWVGVANSESGWKTAVRSWLSLCSKHWKRRRVPERLYSMALYTFACTSIRGFPTSCG
jgi:hypothetical protein